MEELLRTQVAVITREGGFVRLRRTSVPMSAAGHYEVTDFVDRFRFIVPLRERKNLGFLLDSRDAPMIGEDSSMDAMRPFMSELMIGFARVAILVQTALGRLQVTRRVRGDDLYEQYQVGVYADEAQAIAHVMGQSSSTGPVSIRGK
jgi:hypothetical protein